MKVSQAVWKQPILAEGWLNLETAVGRCGVFIFKVKTLCAHQHCAWCAMRRCSSLHTGVRFVVSPCLARRSWHCRVQPAAVSRLYCAPQLSTAQVRFTGLAGMEWFLGWVGVAVLAACQRLSGSRSDTPAAISNSRPEAPKATQWVPNCSKPQPPSQELSVAPAWWPR